jgi:endogenous inhibitor of DNA gyrase (YacG/DUF329 family)
MSLTQTSPTHWSCATCGQDFVLGAPASLARSPSNVRGTLASYCPFCGKASVQTHATTSERVVWL